MVRIVGILYMVVIFILGLCLYLVEYRFYNTEELFVDVCEDQALAVSPCLVSENKSILYKNNIVIYGINDDNLVKIQPFNGVEEFKEFLINGRMYSVHLASSEPINIAKLISLTPVDISRASELKIKILSNSDLLDQYKNSLKTFTVLPNTFAEPLIKIIDTILNLFFSVMGNWVISIGLLALLYKVITLPISLWESKLRRITTYRSNVLKSEKRLISKNSSGEKAHNLLLLKYKELGISPFYILKPLLPTLLQLPFYIVIFYILTTKTEFFDINAFGLTPLYLPERLLEIGGFEISIAASFIAVYIFVKMYMNSDQTFFSSTKAICFSVIIGTVIWFLPFSICIYLTLSLLFSNVQDLLSNKG